MLPIGRVADADGRYSQRPQRALAAAAAVQAERHVHAAARLRDLPTELWMHVLQAPGITPVDLQRIGQTNQYFRALVATPSVWAVQTLRCNTDIDSKCGWDVAFGQAEPLVQRAVVAVSDVFAWTPKTLQVAELWQRHPLLAQLARRSGSLPLHCVFRVLKDDCAQRRYTGQPAPAYGEAFVFGLLAQASSRVLRNVGVAPEALLPLNGLPANVSLG